MNPPIDLCCYVAGRKVTSESKLIIRCPYDGRQVGSVQLAGRADMEAAVEPGRARNLR